MSYKRGSWVQKEEYGRKGEDSVVFCEKREGSAGGSKRLCL